MKMRLYPDDMIIPESLPESYHQTHYDKNTYGPKCYNCAFQTREYCHFWHAQVRDDWVCADWKRR